MSQNTLIEKITNDATSIIAEIKSTGATEVENIQREIEAEVAELSKVHAVALEKTKTQMELVAVSKAKQAGNIAVQTAKRTKIDSVFNAVATDLEGQSTDEYIAFFVKYSTKIVPKGVEVDYVHAPAKRKEETEKILEEAGLSGEVKIDPAIKAGLVLHTKDGVYDITLARLMNEKRPELEMIVVNQVMA
ncbi:MAG: vacuolar-type H+-ATPase subunit E/Vma4 [Candidatus Paceibacteria bacterium]|jgi:vacuolar-type H+-ATPase subunit E/Vma4